MSTLKHITFTGIDIMSDFKTLKEIQREFPIAEFGVLTSYSWFENGNRYLDPSLIGLLRGYEINLSLHICGSAAHDATIGKWEKLDKLTEGNLDLFKRCQLNVSTRKNNPAYCHVPLVIGQEIIIQQRNVNEIGLFTETRKHWYQPMYKWSVLLDASGGRGIDTPIEILESQEKVGYAGGINPENVGDKLYQLLTSPKVGDFWIDMESGVRTDDWLDFDKVYRVLRICREVIAEIG